jgi:anti-sigma factor RsiW
VSNNDYICESENIAAYIEGDLDGDVRASLEEHIKVCGQCAAELRDQRVFMCELDSALASPFDLAVPANFAQMVAVNAESDMRGVRDRAEHKRALRYCIVLGMAAFALLGFAASKALLLSARAISAKAFGILGFFAKTAFDAASGVTVISRVLGRGLIADSGLVGLAGFVLVILAIILLTFLLSRYHRTRLVE